MTAFSKAQTYAYYEIWSQLAVIFINCYHFSEPASFSRAFLARNLKGRHLGFFASTSARQSNFYRHRSQKMGAAVKTKGQKYIKSHLLAKQHILCWSPTRLRVKNHSQTNCFVKTCVYSCLNCESLKEKRRRCLASRCVDWTCRLFRIAMCGLG